ncbi:MAG: hypothetical protein M1820_010811 [Bogoriella megaspora]|nr:MAG: hypothetical protein M1820_010811 [Bogoriella megaspora]
MSTENGQAFIKSLAYFVRTHEKALANALQLQKQGSRNGSSTTGASSFAGLSFSSQTIKPAKLTLTPHHLYYMLTRFEELGVVVGPMNVRLENLHADAGPTNYVSFLGDGHNSKARASDRDSIHSVSSVRSVMSGMSALWSNLGLSSNSTTKLEKQRLATQEDLKYLYSAFTKIPCLRVCPDSKARLISGFEEFPFDSAVPLVAFKNLSALEISDLDFRQFYGWDTVADNLRSLTIKRGAIEDPADVLTNIVLDDMDKRRRRSAKSPSSSTQPWPAPSPTFKPAESPGPISALEASSSPDRRVSGSSPKGGQLMRATSVGSPTTKSLARRRQKSVSPHRPSSSRHGYSTPHLGGLRLRRESGSSGSSRSSTPRTSSSNLLLNMLPATKWRFLRHLSLADNGLTALSALSLLPVANTLQSFDLSSNHFGEIPDSLTSLTGLRALNLSNCMIDSLRSLSRSSLPAITTLNLRANRLASLAGVEGLLALERLDLRDNKLADPDELARVTALPNIREVYVAKNPFTKTHSNYRITIFNLFRKTPGYTEDVLIDSTGPTYAERRHLVDRAPEATNVPIVKPPLEEDDEPAVYPHGGSSGAANSYVVHTSQALQSSAMGVPDSASTANDKAVYGANTQRRRKAGRRRIVELSTSESFQHSQSGDGASDSLAPPINLQSSVDPRNVTETQPWNAPEPESRLPQESRTQSFDSASTVLSSSNDAQDLGDPYKREAANSNLTGEAYRRKIEALRNDLGNGWLSAMGDESWNTQKSSNHFSDRDVNPSRTVRPHKEERGLSRGIVATSRTLG